MAGAPRYRLSDCAERLGLAVRTVKRAAAKGQLKPDANGNYSLAALKAAVAKTTDPGKVAGHSVLGRGSFDPGNRFTALADARADAERARARKLTLAAEQAEGNLIARQQVRSAAENVVIKARAAFLSLGQRVAPKIVGETDERRIVQIVEDEARSILGGLADLAGEVGV